MGEIINVRCSRCGADWQCFTGSGLLHGSRENIVAAFSGRERAGVEKRMAESRIPAWDFSYQPAVCGHCRMVVGVPVLGGTEEEAYVGDCPRCGGRTGGPNPEWEKTPCPACGKRALRAEETGQWD